MASDSLTLQAGSGFGSGLDLQACQAAGQSLWRALSQGLRVESGTGFSLGNVLLPGGFQDSGQVRCFRFFISPVALRAPLSVGTELW